MVCPYPRSGRKGMRERVSEADQRVLQREAAILPLELPRGAKAEASLII